MDSVCAIRPRNTRRTGKTVQWTSGCTQSCSPTIGTAQRVMAPISSKSISKAIRNSHLLQEKQRLVCEFANQKKVLIHTQHVDATPFTDHRLPETNDVHPRKLFGAEFKQLRSNRLFLCTISLSTIANSSCTNGLSDIQKV